MRKLSVVIFLLMMSLAILSSCTRSAGPVVVDSARLQMFAPLPQTVPGKVPVTAEKAALGRMLYYDVRLSKSQKISCNSCHQLEKYGVDGEPTSDGHNGQKGDRNSPSVYNAAGQVAQFWDGRAADVEEQAKGPVMNPVEMAMPSEKQLVVILKSMPDYVQAFKRAFPDSKAPVTFNNMTIAIGSFERNLLTPSRWDKFLAGDQSALSNEEKAGFNAFTSAGCQTCHFGAYVGGSLFQKLGVVRPWPDTTDPGRFKVTKSEADRFVFKVPPLRNAEKTAPYYHNGKVTTLEQAVSMMADYQLGKTLPSDDVESIITWLKSLTGTIPADYIQPPALPKSTPATRIE